MFKNNYHKNLLELFLYKPVGKYQFTMACIRAFVMVVYQVIIWEHSGSVVECLTQD